MHRPLRRLATTTAVSLAVVAALAVPAWAQPSFGDGSAEANSTHTDTLTVPDDERVGTTTQVRMTAPTGFTPTGCTRASVLGDCTVEGQTVTWDGMGALPLTFTVEVTAPVGSHTFRVTQVGDAGEVRWSVPMEVVSPDDTPSDEPSPTDGGSEQPTDEGSEQPSDNGSEQPSDQGNGQPSDDPSTDQTASEAPTGDSTPSTQPSPASAGTASPTPAPSPTPTGDQSDAASSGGSTAPTRTQGRSSGTTLEITPGEPAGDDPTLAAPDVAEQPAVAAPADANDTAPTGETAVAGTTEDAPGREWPWQQVLGAALLATGALTLGIRQWRNR